MTCALLCRRRGSSRRWFAAASGALVALGALLGAPGPAAAEMVTIEIAQQDVNRLKEELGKRKSSNEDLIASLEAVSKAYVGGIQPPPAPPADASEDVKKQHEADKLKHERAVEAFRKQARDLFEKAMTVTVVKGAKDEQSNEREDVNIKAFQVVALTKDPEFADNVMRAIETHLAKAKYSVTTGLWEAAFAALAPLEGDSLKTTKKSIEWITKNYTHANSSPEEAVEQLIAAHKSIPQYKRIPGDQRFALVEAMIVSYTGKESQAEQASKDPKNQAAKVFWDRIKLDAIKALQHLSKGQAMDDKNQALASMKDFQDWFREHKNPKKEPWVGDLGDATGAGEKKDTAAGEEKKPEEKKESPGK